MSGPADTGSLGGEFGDRNKVNGCDAIGVRRCDAVAIAHSLANLTYLNPNRNLPRPRGAIAQLGERLHGMQEVGGSIPPGSTISVLRPHRLEAQDIALSRR